MKGQGLKGRGRSRSRQNRRGVVVVEMAVVLAFCALAHSVAALVPVAVVAGAAYGVVNVALFELLDVVVPSHRAVQAMTCSIDWPSRNRANIWLWTPRL